MADMHRHAVKERLLEAASALTQVCRACLDQRRSDIDADAERVVACSFSCSSITLANSYFEDL